MNSEGLGRVERLKVIRAELAGWVERVGWTARWIVPRTRYAVTDGAGEGLMTVVRAPTSADWGVDVRCGPNMPWTYLGAYQDLDDALAMGRSVALLDRYVHPLEGWWVNLEPLTGSADVRRPPREADGGRMVACVMSLNDDGSWKVRAESAADSRWASRNTALSCLASRACELAYVSGAESVEIDQEQLARTSRALEGF